MTFLDAAQKILEHEGSPLHYREIIRRAIEQDLLSKADKTSEVAMRSQLSSALRKNPKETPFVRTGPGIYTLRDGAKSSRKKPAKPAKERSKKAAAKPAPGPEVAEERAEKPAKGRAKKSAAKPAPRPEVAREQLAIPAKERAKGAAAKPAPEPEVAAEQPAKPTNQPRDEWGNDQARAAHLDNAAGSGQEADHSQPQSKVQAAPPDVGSPAPTVVDAASEKPLDVVAPTEPTGGRIEGRDEVQSEGHRGGRRTRRNRPSRGRADSDESARPVEPATSPLPSQASEPPPQESSSRNRRRRKRRRKSPPAVSGDVVTVVTRALESRGGAVPLAELANQLQGDPAAARERIVSSLAAENALDRARGRRPRFALGTNDVDLCSRMLGPDIAQAEQRILAEHKRLEGMARQQMASMLATVSLPGWIAIAEACLEDDGWTEIRSRQTSEEGIAHLTCRAKSGESATLAVVVARGGASGREGTALSTRLATLRGSLHEQHASRGLLMTSDMADDDARHALTAPGAPCIELWDGAEVARRMERLGLGVSHTTIRLPFVDAAFFTGLKK